jgi:hypothetical protein
MRTLTPFDLRTQPVAELLRAEAGVVGEQLERACVRTGAETPNRGVYDSASVSTEPNTAGDDHWTGP